ncbi:membrane protein [Burkholderia pseudomallei]|nr:membrane protein [Burkholderia pseudomallei]
MICVQTNPTRDENVRRNAVAAERGDASRTHARASAGLC